jgi:hypothetical protein
MQDKQDYQAALKTLRKLLVGARNASEQGKYAALERIIQGAEKISEHLLNNEAEIEFKEAINAKQSLNREFVDSFINMSKSRHDYIKVVGEIIS